MQMLMFIAMIIVNINNWCEQLLCSIIHINVFLYLLVHTDVYVCVLFIIQICFYVYMYKYVYMHVCIYIRTSVYIWYVCYVYNMYVCVCMICSNIYVCIYICMYVCTIICIYMCV